MPYRFLVATAVTTLTGCMFEGHLGGGIPTHSLGDNGRSAVAGAAAIGAGGGDDHQWGGVLLGLGASPLAARGDAVDAPRETLIEVGGTYQRAFTERRPWLRGYTRLMIGGNLCRAESSPKADGTTPMPTEDCVSEASRRSVTEVSIALGVALAKTRDAEHALVPPFVSGGLGVVYTFASDAALGDRQFIGLELSFAMGGDPVSGIGKH